MKRTVQAVSSVGAVLGVVFGAWFVDDRYASAGQLEKVIQSVEALTARIDRSIITDQIDRWMHQKISMEVRFGFDCRDCDLDQRATYAQIVSKLGRLHRELN